MMKRTLVAAAVTALSVGTAFAQSSVTVYGRLNTSIEQQKNIGVEGDRSVLQNNASRLGFKGTEDLGGGLKAIFLLEHRFNADTGTVTGDFYAGDSFVGLESAQYGTLRLGRLTSASYYATADWVSNHNHDTGTSDDKFYTYLGANKNSVAYLTPSFGGFTVEGSVSAGEGTGNQNKVFGLAANYDGGPLQLGAGYEQNDPSDKQFGLRAAYTFGAITFGGYYQRSEITSAELGNYGTRDAVRGSVMYVMGQSELHLNVGWADDWSKISNSGATQYTLAYNYNLSKRTKVYAFYTAVDNGNNFSYFGATSAGGAVLDPSSFAVGVRHNF